MFETKIIPGILWELTCIYACKFSNIQVNNQWSSVHFLNNLLLPLNDIPEHVIIKIIKRKPPFCI